LVGWVQGMVHVQYTQSVDMPVISYMEKGVKEADLSALQNRVGNETPLGQRGMGLNQVY
jgi:hypothetical protein